MKHKADWDAADEGGEPVLDESYPPHGAPLYWNEFRSWARDNLPAHSLAVIDDRLADPVTAAGLQCFRAGRTARQSRWRQGREGLARFMSWASVNLRIRSNDPQALAIAERCYQAGRFGRQRSGK